MFPPTEEILERILEDGEPVFDVRDLGGEGGGIKVVQEVSLELDSSLPDRGLCGLKGQGKGLMK